MLKQTLATEIASWQPYKCIKSRAHDGYQLIASKSAFLYITVDDWRPDYELSFGTKISEGLKKKIWSNRKGLLQHLNPVYLKKKNLTKKMIIGSYFMNVHVLWFTYLTQQQMCLEWVSNLHKFKMAETNIVLLVLKMSSVVILWICYGLHYNLPQIQNVLGVSINPKWPPILNISLVFQLSFCCGLGPTLSFSDIKHAWCENV